MRARKSPIWAMDKGDFAALVKKSTCRSDVLRYFGLQNKGGNGDTLKKRLIEDGVDFSHFTLKTGYAICPKPPITREQFLLRLVKDSKEHRHSTKTFLIRFGLLEEKCSECGMGKQWNGKDLTLVLDHKNGISNDNRLENLRFLCPNCNSQTNTFAGRNNKPSFCHVCPRCQQYKCRSARLCRKCSETSRARKFIRPSEEELRNLVSKHPIMRVAKRFNCAYTSVRKWCIGYNIDYKNMSPFSRVNRKKVIKPRVFFPKSKYTHVSLCKERGVWMAMPKVNGLKKYLGRFSTEEEAARAVAAYFKSPTLILRKSPPRLTHQPECLSYKEEVVGATPTTRTNARFDYE